MNTSQNNLFDYLISSQGSGETLLWPSTLKVPHFGNKIARLEANAIKKIIMQSGSVKKISLRAHKRRGDAIYLLYL